MTSRYDIEVKTYEVPLNLNEQRMALMTMLDQLTRQYFTVDRKRWNMSEKVMTKAQLSRHIVALRMAVDRIDALLKVQNAA
jgi:predicted FMN-binding regulatory protein PaiB